MIKLQNNFFIESDGTQYTLKQTVMREKKETKEDTKPNVQKHSFKSKVSHHKIGGLKK